MRRQVKAYLTAHGTDPDKIDEQTFLDICTMYVDGLIGNHGLLDVLGNLTAVQFNKALPKGKSPYNLRDIIPHAFDYLYPPPTEQEKKERANAALLTFMMTRQGAPKVLAEGNNG